MGILQFIAKVCVQTAVYWEGTGISGFGTPTYATPVEIACRWDGVSETITNSKGIEITSSAKITVTQTISKTGYLYLGFLEDLSVAQKADPLLVDGAYEIQKIEVTPLFKSDDKFVNLIYL